MSTAATVPQVDKPVEITLGDGSVVKGATLQEAFDNLKTMKENASAAKRTAEQNLQTLQGQYENLQQEVEKLKNPPRVDDGKSFNKDQYYQLLNNDPIAAQDYMDRYRYDMPREELVAKFNHVTAQVDNLTQQSVGAAFIAQHAEDFPPDPEAARAMSQRVSQLQMRGLPFNLDTVNYAYTQLVNEKVITPVEKQEVVEHSPNPSLTGAGRVSAEQGELERVEKMSDADLEKYLRSKGIIR